MAQDLINALQTVIGTTAVGDTALSTEANGIYHDLVNKTTEDDGVTLRAGVGIYGSIKVLHEDIGTASADSLQAQASAAEALVSENAAAQSATTASDAVSSIGTSATGAEASATAAAASEALADADATQTALDRISTNADVVATNANAITTSSDAVITNADSAQTGLDRIATAADRVQTGLDILAIGTAVVDTAADVVVTNANKIATNADVLQTAADALVTEAAKIAAQSAQTAVELIFDTYDDRFLGAKATEPTVDNDGDPLLIGAVYYNSTTLNIWFYNGTIWEAPDTAASQSAVNAAASAAAALVSEGLADVDAIQTASDRTATNADVISTAADVVVTNADSASTSADVILVEADKVQTGLDRLATNADVVSTNADVVLTNADAISTAANVISTNADAASTAQDSIDTNQDLIDTTAIVANIQNGRTWFFNAVDPTTEGVDGDLAYNTASSDVFEKVTGTWVLSANLVGNGISSVIRTSGDGSQGTTDTYTITFTDTNTTTFGVYNGIDGLGTLVSIVGGINTTVDNTDPANPIISSVDTIYDETDVVKAPLGILPVLDGSNLTNVSTVASIDDLTDVDITTALPGTGDTLEWDGTKFVPATLATQGNLDAHAADTTIHFTQGSISITESQISDFGVYLTTETVYPSDSLLAQDITDIGNLSGINTGDQTTITGNSGTATTLETTRNINGVAFNGSADITINAVDSTARIALSEKGAINGVAELDASGLVPSTQLPSYVDDVVMAVNLAAIQLLTLESGKVYVAEDTNITYRWSGTGTTMVKIGSDLALGITASTAFQGDLGDIAYLHSQEPHAPSTAEANDVNTTLQGNTFNGVSQLVQLDTNGILPPVDGSALINMVPDTEHYNQETAPVNPGQGSTWYIPSVGETYKNVNDGTSAVWVDIGTAATGVTTEYVDAIKSSNYLTAVVDYTALHRDYILCDTSTAPFNITLPITPNAFDLVTIFDSTGNFSVNNVTVLRNGETIMGLAEDMTLNTNNEKISLIYTGTDWRIT